MIHLPLNMSSLPIKPETETPSLDSFLGSAMMRPLTGVAQRQWMREVFAVRITPDPFAPETKPHRIMVMWRITRTTAIVSGICAEDETLDSATETLPSPWFEPFRPSTAISTESPLRRSKVDRVVYLRRLGKGLPLLPPRGAGAGLERWCDVASIIAADLGVERTREGLLGLQGLLDPELCYQNDVTNEEILAFEELLLVESLDLLLDVGERATLRHFREKHGFSNKEANGLLKVVKTQAMHRGSGSIEEKRALAEMRLEDFIGRSKATMDMDGEMKGIKELAKIQGLTRTEPENQAAEFFEVVKRISSTQDAQRLDPETLRLMNGASEEVQPRIIEATPVEVETDHDDAEALAEYDNEN